RYVSHARPRLFDSAKPDDGARALRTSARERGGRGADCLREAARSVLVVPQTTCSIDLDRTRAKRREPLLSDPLPYAAKRFGEFLRSNRIRAQAFQSNRAKHACPATRRGFEKPACQPSSFSSSENPRRRR